MIPSTDTYEFSYHAAATGMRPVAAPMAARAQPVFHKDGEDEKMAIGAPVRPAHAGPGGRLYPDPLPHSAGARSVRFRQAARGRLLLRHPPGPDPGWRQGLRGPGLRHPELGAAR